MNTHNIKIYKFYRKPWTEESVKLMEEWWPHFGTDGMESILSLRISQIKSKATKMGLHLLPKIERLCIVCRKKYQFTRYAGLLCRECHLSKRKIKRRQYLPLEKWISLLTNTARYHSKSTVPQLEKIDEIIEFIKNSVKHRLDLVKPASLYQWINSFTKNVIKRKTAIKCNLTTDYMVDLWYKQKGRCYYSGIEMIPHIYGNGREPYSPSIDRIVPENGYVKGNVAWTCWVCNCGKSNLSVSDYISICRKVVEKQDNKNN